MNVHVRLVCPMLETAGDRRGPECSKVLPFFSKMV